MHPAPLLRTLVAVFATISIAIANAAESPGSSSNRFVYIGTFTGGQSKGIYVARFDAASGKLSALELAAESSNPSFLIIHPGGRFLYAANEINSFQGKNAGAISAFAVDRETHKLTLINQQSSGGTGPCHISLDRTGQCLLVANYAGGSVAALPIRADGSLGETGSFIQHHGSSINAQRQEAPHAHQILTVPDNRIALVCDLGLDRILAYELDPAHAKLTPADPPFVSVKAGSGPRHLAFHPKGPYAFLLSEMGSTLTSFGFDSQRHNLKELETVSTLPENYSGRNSSAELAVHPSGKFIYASNRGDDSIAVFSFDPTTGKLALVERQSTHGRTPRFIGLDPSGSFLFACNQDSNNIAVFRIAQSTGGLEATGTDLEVTSPVCLGVLDF